MRKGEKTRDNTRRRQEAQLDKKSKIAFFRGGGGARATKQSHRKESKSLTFFSYHSLFSYIQYFFEETWVNRNTGVGQRRD